MRHRAGRERLGHALNLAEAGDWGAAAAELTAGRPEASSPAFPLLDAAVLLLADRRPEAIAALVEAQRRDPADPKVNHMLLLAVYHTLRDPQAGSRLAAGVAASLARHAIASWVVLMHQERFWTTWLADRLSRYGEDRLEAAAWRPELLAELTARIEDLEAQSDDLGASKALLQRELAAAEQLAAAGGFPLPGKDAETIVCGTLMIQALGCQEAFGAFVASLPAGDGDAAERIQRLLQRFLDPFSPPASRRRLALEEQESLRRSFSRLGLAQALLDRDRPEEAWAALAELACQECRAAASGGSSGAPVTGWLPVVCAATCPCFDRENPGYAGWPEKAQCLEREALELAIRIQLALGYAGMTALESDPRAAAQRFREALRLAAILGQQEDAESLIVEAVLGRVKALADKGSLTPAIELLEAGLAACCEAGAASPAPADPAQPAASRDQLAGQLAEILTWRGIAAANDRRWEAAVTDLRRAVALNPHATNPLLALSFVLQSRARQLRRTFPAQAVELALEAVRQLQPRLPDLVGRPEAQTRLEQAREAARSLLHRRATDLAAASGFDQSLQILEQGLAVLAGDPVLTGCHREIVLQYARYLSERGQSERALAVLRRAK